MKELQDIQDKILACGIPLDAESVLAFNRDGIEDSELLLPDDIRQEILALQREIEACLPEDFDYFAEFGLEGAPPLLDLEVDDSLALSVSPDSFDFTQPLIPQLKELDWEELRLQAIDEGKMMDVYAHVIELMRTPLPPTKQLQRTFRDEMKEFVKGVRNDTARIHVLWWTGKELSELRFVDGDELRKELPRILFEVGLLVAVVAYGKPLPADRIDALNAEAQKNLAKYADEQLAFEDEGETFDGVIEIEGTVVQAPPFSDHPSDDAIEIEGTVVEDKPSSTA